MIRNAKPDPKDAYWIAAIVVMAILLAVGLIFYYGMSVRLDEPQNNPAARTSRQHSRLMSSPISEYAVVNRGGPWV